MDTNSFSGRLSDMRESPWLASEDLERPDSPGYIELTATIKAVMEIRNATFAGGRTKPKGYALEFAEFTRMLYLNATNRVTLKELHGRTAPEVVGKRITLYVNPKVKLAGKLVPGIRIKAAATVAPSLTAEQREFVAEATKKFESAETPELLEGYGATLKEQPEAVRAALKPIYAKRKQELTDADH